MATLSVALMAKEEKSRMHRLSPERQVTQMLRQRNFSKLGRNESHKADILIKNLDSELVQNIKVTQMEVAVAASLKSKDKIKRRIFSHYKTPQQIKRTPDKVVLNTFNLLGDPEAPSGSKYKAFKSITKDDLRNLMRGVLASLATKGP